MVDFGTILTSLIGGGILSKVIDTWVGKRRRGAEDFALAQQNIALVLQGQRTLLDSNTSLVAAYEVRLAEMEAKLKKARTDCDGKLEDERKEHAEELNRLANLITLKEEIIGKLEKAISDMASSFWSSTKNLQTEPGALVPDGKTTERGVRPTSS